MAGNDINLLRRTAGGLAELSSYEERLRTASWYGLLALLVAGVCIATGYIIINARYRSLQQEQVNLSRQLAAATTKEGILVSLTQRIGIANKALAAVKPWGNLFPILSSFAPANEFNTIAIDEQGRVNVVMALPSVDEAVAVVANVLTLADQKKLRSPQMLSFTFREDATIQLGLSFIPSL
jgi:drug/metabolite transporter (DMT)-like permease